MSAVAIGLGDRVKDTITGFEGITTGRAEYITGCVQFVVVPPIKDGKLIESEWFDEVRLEFIEKGFTPNPTMVAKNPAGPQRDMPR